jgi:uncharacterized protein
MSAAPSVGTAIPKLGVGLPYFSALPPELYRSGLVDFVEVTPETICRKRRVGDTVALEIIAARLERARNTCAALPLVVHGVGLSIGFADGWNDGYLQMLDALQSKWPFVWHSEHLGFQTIQPEGVAPAVDRVAGRVREIQDRYGVPFLLENPAYRLPNAPANPEAGGDIGLMRTITQNSGCFQLLDLHNIYCNAINNEVDPLAAIDGMPLNAVVEIHIDGGSCNDGLWMDAHDGRVPEAVWELLEYALPRCPLAGGIVFEMRDSHAERMGMDAIQQELLRVRKIWDRCKRG